MNVILRIPRAIDAAIRRDLARSHPFAAERIGFLFTKQSKLQNGEDAVVLGVSYEPVDDSDYVDDPNVGARINSRAIRSVMQTVLSGGLGAFHVHLHEHAGVPRLSWIDQKEIRPLMVSVRNAGPSSIHGLLVLSEDSAHAEVLVPNASEPRAAHCFSVVGFPTNIVPHESHPRPEHPDFSRQSFLGSGAQDRISTCRIGIIGLGGGGSHIVQQLAHIGFESFTLFDHDTLEVSNLNRLVGATKQDADMHNAKAVVAARVIRGINPKAKVSAIQTRWQDGPQHLRGCDIIFGCLDSYAERRELEVFSRRHLIPYIDIGLDVNHSPPEAPRMAGQVILSMPKEKCMSCMGFLTAEKFAREAERYGAAGPRAQVVWANGILASTAVGIGVDILTDWTRSLRGPVYLSYDSNTGTIQPHKRLSYLPPGECPHFPGLDVGEPRFENI